MRRPKQAGRPPPDPSQAGVPFTVDADLCLGSAVASWVRSHGADVTVRRGAVPEELAEATVQRGAWSCAGRRVLVRRRGIRFLVENGETIRYQTAADAPEANIRLSLFGSAWAALLLQRNLLPLHASAVCRGADVYAFAGKSRAGKSTLAAALAARGLDFVTDDVLVLDPLFGSDTRCYGCTELKLWPDALELTRASRRTLIHDRADKLYAVPATQAQCPAGRLRALYVLAEEAGDRSCRIEPVTGSESIDVLARSLHRRRLTAAIVGRRRLYEWLAQMRKHVRVSRFRRSRLISRFDEGVAHVETLLS